MRHLQPRASRHPPAQPLSSAPTGVCLIAHNETNWQHFSAQTASIPREPGDPVWPLPQFDRMLVNQPSGALYCVADDRPSTQLEYAEWLAARLGVPLPADAGASRYAVRNRRVINARLKRELEYTFRYPTFVEGEMAIEADEKGG